MSGADQDQGAGRLCAKCGAVSAPYWNPCKEDRRCRACAIDYNHESNGPGVYLTRDDVPEDWRSPEAAAVVSESAVRAAFDAHQKVCEERDRAIGALLCAAWHGCLSFDRARELLGMTTVQLRAEANRIFAEEKP